MIFMHYFLLPARICCCKFYNNLTGKGLRPGSPSQHQKFALCLYYCISALVCAMLKIIILLCTSVVDETENVIT